MKTTKPKKFCFVLMPFDDDFNDIYQLGIKQSCEDAGAYCERVDEQIFNESILDRIYNQISKADIVIADLTKRNANVFYEVGYAHALGKTTILLTQNVDDIPFDLKHYPHIVYDNKITKLKDELTTRIKWCVENDITSDNDLKVDLDIYLGSHSLSSKNVIYVVPKRHYCPSPKFTLHNNSFTTYNPGEYSIGIITDVNYPNLIAEGSKRTKLPDGRLLHLYPKINDILYPDLYLSFDVFLEPIYLDESQRSYKEEQEITIRVFSSKGTRDFYLTIKYEQD